MFRARLVTLALLAAACSGGSSGGMGTNAPAADPAPPEQGGPSYVRLSETGLYANIASKALSPDLTFFQPAHFLWSDGTEKRRWLRLPAGTRIDSSDMDNWQLPVGTQVFKEFSLGGVLLETRLIERYGPGPSDYWMGSFVWSADASDAVFAPLGSENVVGTGHDVPSTAACQQCHIGETGRLLGFTAVQLSGQREGATLSSLAASGVLSSPPPAGADYGTPGDPTTAAALGYLHANCGHCHNPRGIGYQFNDLELRLSVGESSPEQTGAYRTGLGQPLTVPIGSLVFRVRRGFPEESAVWQLMNTRTAAQKMPPLATELVDPAGLGLVEDWIRSLE